MTKHIRTLLKDQDKLENFCNECNHINYVVYLCVYNLYKFLQKNDENVFESNLKIYEKEIVNKYTKNIQLLVTK